MTLQLKGKIKQAKANVDDYLRYHYIMGCIQLLQMRNFNFILTFTFFFSLSPYRRQTKQVSKYLGTWCFALCFNDNMQSS